MRRALALLAMALLSACTTFRAQPLATLPLSPTQGAEVASRTGSTVIVFPFEELRGPEYGVRYATSNVPFLGLFHSGAAIEYPEQHASMETGDHETVLIGDLASALPSLLATMMRRMHLTPNAMAVSELAPMAGPRTPDYFLTGQIKKSTFEEHQSPIVGVTLGLLGVPHLFARITLEVQIALYRARAPNTPVFQKTYQLKDWRVGGLYYQHSPRTPMLTRALERTLTQAVQDISLAMR